MSSEALQFLISSNQIKEFEYSAKKNRINYLVRNSETQNYNCVIEIIEPYQPYNLFHLGREFEIQIHKSISLELNQ